SLPPIGDAARSGFGTQPTVFKMARVLDLACVANENEKSLVSHLLPSTTRSRNCDTAYVVRLVYRTTCLRHALGRLPKC
ncbi:unnamed protein product, partial [Mycena citricolor]